MNANCSVVVSASGAKCGAPAVHAFEGASGERFAECAAHYAGAHAAPKVGYDVGDRVAVRRYGREYDAAVVEVGARGAVYAEFVYGNGAKRRVRV